MAKHKGKKKPNYEKPKPVIKDEKKAPEKKSKGKVAKVMKEFKSGKLHSGSKKGPQVTNPKQAVAIAYSEAKKAKKKK